MATLEHKPTKESREKGKLANSILFTGVCLLSLSSWVDIKGMCTVLPLLISTLPEGWSLPSYICIIVQTANVAPLTYLLLKKLKADMVKEWLAAIIIISIGALSCFILVFSWDKTSYFAGESRSTALLTLSFFLAIVDCTSTVVYLPYIARFRSPIVMTAFYVGEGLSGLIPALIGIAQVSGTEIDESWKSGSNSTSWNGTLAYHPSLRFSVSVFFALLTVLLLVSLVSFLFLHFHPYFKAFESDNGTTGSMNKVPVDSDSEIDQFLEINYSETGNEGTKDSKKSLPLGLKSSLRWPIYFPESNGNTDSMAAMGGVENKSRHVLILLILTTWICFLLYGIIPAVQSYACLPYGYLAYDLAVKLSILACPLACFLTLCLMTKRLSIISFIVLIGSIASAYQLYLASTSPNLILMDGKAGIILAIISSVTIWSSLNYALVCVSAVLSDLGGEKLLLYCGIFTQVGAFLGAFTGFLLAKVFEAKRR